MDNFLCAINNGKENNVITISRLKILKANTKKKKAESKRLWWVERWNKINEDEWGSNRIRQMGQLTNTSQPSHFFDSPFFERSD